ncbi:MAG: hypothetical protein ACKORF_05760 [Micrococcales bacterium]
MIEQYYAVAAFLNLGVGVFALALGFLGRPPSGWSVGALALTELTVLIQLVITVVLVISGETASLDIGEFWAYLITAVFIPVAAVFWALLERSKWSTVVLGVGALSIAVMLVRMHQIWTGSYN